MKKKGFTLIELLAVIVILAIIALIATPLVLKYIEKSRKESKVDSAYSFVRNLETEIANYSIKHNGKKYNGQPSDKGYYELTSFENSEIDTTVKGDKPNSIKVCLSSLGQVDKAMFEYGKYYVSYDGKKGSISDKDTYDNFSCSLVTKIEVPEATKELNFVYNMHFGRVNNSQGLIYYKSSGDEILAPTDDDDFFRMSLEVGFYKVPISLFKEPIPTDENIEVTVTFLDGSQKTVELEKDNYRWHYYSEDQVPYISDDDGWNISFYPNKDIGSMGGNSITVDSDTYHVIDTGVGNKYTHGWQSIKILGTTLYFNNGLVSMFYSLDSNENPLPLYNDPTKLNRIIVNYKDGSQDVYNLEDINVPQNDKYNLIMYAEMLMFHYKGIEFNYKDDIFKSLPKLATITFEEDGIMTTYKIADNATIVYKGPEE